MKAVDSMAKLQEAVEAAASGRQTGGAPGDQVNILPTYSNTNAAIIVVQICFSVTMLYC
jgi:hypothetical protein